MITDELTANEITGFDGRDGFEDLYLLVADGFAIPAGGTLDGEIAHDLKDVVFDNVADAAVLIVEGPAALDAEVLGHGDLHAFDVVAMPEGLEEGVGESEGDHVVHGSLGEVVVDAEDGGLGERREQHAVQFLRGSES